MWLHVIALSFAAASAALFAEIIPLGKTGDITLHMRVPLCTYLPQTNHRARIGYHFGNNFHSPGTFGIIDLSNNGRLIPESESSSHIPFLDCPAATSPLPNQDLD